MKTMNLQNYQGDISILSNQAIEEISKNLSFSPLPKEGLIVAEGEITGHRHLLVVDHPETQVEFAKDQNGYFIQVSGGNALLTHEEHKTRIIPQGVHFIGRQWEYDELEEKRIVD